MRWLLPGEACARPRAADLLQSSGLEDARACLDELAGPPGHPAHG
jgi:hypothetical protein